MIKLAAMLTFTIIAEAHSGLAQTNCVLSGAGTVELLEFGLLDILRWEVLACADAKTDVGRENGP